MGFITTGLTKNAQGKEGVTSHYAFSYDATLQRTAANPTGPEPARTNAVIAACEGDFNQMSAWFANVALDVKFPIPVNITQNSGGASWNLSDSNLTVTIKPGGRDAATVRYLMVSEMVEQFMRAHGKGWFGSGTEGSQGEGLSRFLATQFLAINALGTPPPGFDNSNAWLRSSRADFVNNIRAMNDGPDEVTGCSLLFIYYLFSQLGFTIEAIVAAGANTLGKVYQNLTGDMADPFPAFKHQLDIVYPGTSTITGPNLDNPYPIGKKVVWHNSATNETQIWFMNGERVAHRATVLGENGAAAFVGPPWRIVGTANMNLAGNSDIVWHNSSTNETQIWFIDGERVARRGTVLGENGAAAFVGPPWRIAGTGDMNGNGMLDIVWHNSATNETQIWFMDGERVARRGTVLGENGAAAFVGPPWRIVGIGDMNGDGRSDIVWHNSSTNETQIWFMNGERVARRGTVLGENGAAAFVGPPWRIVGAADMTKNRQADIVWHNSSTNETQIWFMNGERVARRGTVLGESGAAAFVGPPWRIVGTGDMNGDGMLEILWHNSSTNDIQFWFVDGPQIKGRNGVIDEIGHSIQVGAPWHIAGVTGLTSESAILWHNSSTNDIQFWFVDGPQIKGRNGVVDETGNIIRVGSPWHIVGVTGLASETAILWHNGLTDDIQFWFMDGSRIKGRNGVVDETGSIIRVGEPWNIVGVTGLAGETAILWHNSSTNDIQFWFMDGSRIKGRNGVVDETGHSIQVGEPWNIAGVVGFASESAILWHNSSTNDIQFWFMDGSRIKGRNGVVDETDHSIQVGEPWNIAGIGGG